MAPQAVAAAPTDDFDPERSIALWRSPTDTPDQPLETADPTGWAKPTAPVFSMTETELTQLPEIERTPAGARLQAGGINLPIEAQVLTRQDFATILLIRDNLGKRPIYFSWSAAGYPDQTFGLTEHLISEGLVRRLVSEPVQETGSVIFSPSVGFVDAGGGGCGGTADRWRRIRDTITRGSQYPHDRRSPDIRFGGRGPITAASSSSMVYGFARNGSAGPLAGWPTPPGGSSPWR